MSVKAHYYNLHDIKGRYNVKIDIHYCVDWNYKPEAASVAEELHNAFGVKANLVPGHNGIFDVIVDGEKVFSKLKAGRFPDPGEVTSKIR